MSCVSRTGLPERRFPLIKRVSVDPVRAHDYTATVTAPTCTEKGYTTHTCSNCSSSYVDSYTDALKHNYVDTVIAPTCTEKGYTKHTCSRCNNSYTDSYTDMLEHSWDEGVITTEPTADAPGVKTFTCKRCRATKTEAVSNLVQQEVSWMPAGPITVTYGDFAYTRPTAYNDSVEDCTFTYSSSNPAVATVNANGKTTIVGAGTTVITATAPAVPGKFAETSASYTLNVNKAALTVTANNHTIAYGQVPADNGYNVSGLVGGDTESVLTGTAAYTYGYEQYGKLGTYDITLSGLSANNYNIAFVNGTLTVEKAKNYTISLGKLEQVADHTSAVSASVEPYDATAIIKVEYQVDGQWTETVPTKAGSYQIRARLTASDNIVLDHAYTNDTLVVKKGVAVDPGQGVENIDISVDVKDDKASLDIADASQITDKADGDVKIDLGGVSGVKDLELPGSLLTGLSKNDKANSLTVTTEDASLKLSDQVLDTVADAVKSVDDTVTVRLTSVEKNELNDKQQAALNSLTQDAVIVEVSLIITHADNSTTELHELGGKVEITVPYDGPVPEGKYIVVSYVSDDGGVSYVRATYNKETRQVSFSTNHFSDYALFLSGKNAYDVTVTGGSGSGTYLEGSTVAITANSKGGYSFNEWEIVSGDVTLANAAAAQTTFTMSGSNVELKATYTRNSSGGSSGGGSSSSGGGSSSSGGGSSSSGSSSSKPTPEQIFADVPTTAYYYEAVKWAADKSITGGIGNNQFAPNQPCTRAQIVAFLWRTAGSPEPKTMNSFDDVSADAYYAKAIAWAVENGITSGTGNGKFSPNDTCTRAQVVTFLYRAAGSPAVSGSAAFLDVDANAYYAAAVAWAAQNDITGGIGDNLFGTVNNCTRAQIVTFLYRTYQSK